jgi:hypothetical protein
MTRPSCWLQTLVFIFPLEKRLMFVRFGLTSQEKLSRRWGEAKKNGYHMPREAVKKLVFFVVDQRKCHPKTVQRLCQGGERAAQTTKEEKRLAVARFAGSMAPLGQQFFVLTLALAGVVMIVAAPLSGLVDRSDLPQVGVFWRSSRSSGPQGCTDS